jgi:uncharacterized pyridoxamine 5'-phosphate oxidase family protein
MHKRYFLYFILPRFVTSQSQATYEAWHMFTQKQTVTVTHSYPWATSCSEIRYCQNIHLKKAILQYRKVLRPMFQIIVKSRHNPMFCCRCVYRNITFYL